MKTIIAFNSEKEIFQILGWEYTGDYKKDEPLHDKLWNAGFNLDDWDAGFACKEPLCEWRDDRTDKVVPHPQNYMSDAYGCDDFVYQAWPDDVYWLGRQMENYCVGYNYCYFEGYHWYTVHHS